MALPKAATPHALLVKQLSRAARQATRVDDVTGNPYRAYHCVEEKLGQLTLNLWRDIDEAPRNFMVKSLKARGDQVLSDVVQMSFDADHWNRINPGENPIPVNTDYTLAVNIRKNAPKMIDGD